MPVDIEDRVARLERFRYLALGVMNAQNTMLLDLWCNFIDVNERPLETAKRLQKSWLADAEAPTHNFPGVDPAELDLVSQEYREALEQLSNAMIHKFLGGPEGTAGMSGS